MRVCSMPRPDAPTDAATAGAVVRAQHRVLARAAAADPRDAALRAKLAQLELVLEALKPPKPIKLAKTESMLNMVHVYIDTTKGHTPSFAF